MSIIARATRPRPDPRSWNPTLVTDAIASARNGTSTYAGRAVNTDVAMRLSAFWACVRLLADTVAALPVDTYRDVPGSESIEIAAPPLVRAPSTHVTWGGWVYQVMVSLLTAGNAYGLVTESSGGFASKIEIVAPTDMQVSQDSPLTPLTYRYRGHEVDPSLVWHVPAWLVPGSAVGLSPVAYARQSIGTGLAAEEYAGRWFGDGGHPTQALVSDQPITQEQAQVAKSRYVDAVGSSLSLIHI